MKTQIENAKSGKSTKKVEIIAVSEKMQVYGETRKQRINERYLNACNYSVTKASTANVINDIATANTFNSVTVETLCKSYIDFVKSLKTELPREVIGLLKKYGCDTIRQQVNEQNIMCFIDAKAHINNQSVVRLVCKFHKDIADIIKNVRTEQKTKQGKK